jgi:glycosyltransferase involved in cell wall biosynthesis
MWRILNNMPSKTQKTGDNLVSTIIPVYNRPRLLQETVNSVLSQTYRPIEVIVVDDGSTDETGVVADRIAAQHPNEVHVIHQEHAGPGVAREAGRLLAKGAFIQYLDSDDVLLRRKFEWQVDGLQKNPQCGVSYGKTRFYHYGDTPSDTPCKRTGERIDTMFPSLLKSRWWGTSTPLYRRELIDESGPWQPLVNEEDWEYDCRIAAFGVKLHYCEEFVSDTRGHSGPRLSHDGSIDRQKLAHRAKAHRLIYHHAVRAGINHTAPEMEHFARELFLLSRQCGSRGLCTESHMLFRLSRAASGSIRSNRWDFRGYALLATVFGWRLTGKLSCLIDRFR